MDGSVGWVMGVIWFGWLGWVTSGECDHWLVNGSHWLMMS